MRAGETMEQAVCDVCKDIRIGKILIQTNQLTGEPEVILCGFRLEKSQLYNDNLNVFFFSYTI